MKPYERPDEREGGPFEKTDDRSYTDKLCRKDRQTAVRVGCILQSASKDRENDLCCTKGKV